MRRINLQTLELKAHAKINFTLDVLARRPDGYHEVEMVMQAIALHDRVILQEQAAGITVQSDHPAVPSGPQNLAYRAARLLQEYCQIERGVAINLQKRIPVAAGLAGGSSDAAAVLTGLNQLWRLHLSLAELQCLGARLGADIPFCLQGGTAVARGIGEQLTAVPGVPRLWLVLVKPPFGISTAAVYRSLRVDRITNHPDTAAMLQALAREDYAAIRKNLRNVLEDVVLAKYPQIARLKEKLQAAGAQGALMSGSGPTVFGIARDRAEAERIQANLAALDAQTYVTHTL